MVVSCTWATAETGTTGQQTFVISRREENDASSYNCSALLGFNIILLAAQWRHLAAAEWVIEVPAADVLRHFRRDVADCRNQYADCRCNAIFAGSKLTMSVNNRLNFSLTDNFLPIRKFSFCLWWIGCGFKPQNFSSPEVRKPHPT